MARSANRTTHPISTPRTDTQWLFAHFAGAGAANATFDASETLNGEITTVTFNSTGNYTIAFRYSYPELKMAPVWSFAPNATSGLAANFAAIDITAGTATMLTTVGSTLTNMAAGDTLYLCWAVRNSGKNK